MGSRIILQPVQRTILRFLENAAQVFSHNTKTHQVQAAENRNQDRHRRPARYSLSCNDTVQYMQDHQHTGHSGKDTDVKSHAERQRRIRDDAVHSEMKHLAHGELRNTGVTGRRLKLDRSLLETKASDNAADKTAVFTELLESFQPSEAKPNRRE